MMVLYKHIFYTDIQGKARITHKLILKALKMQRLHYHMIDNVARQKCRTFAK